MNSAKYENEALEMAVRRFKDDWDQNKSFDILSSGSTGEPKKIKINKSQMVLSASKTISFFQFENGIKALVCLSMDTIAGKMMLARSMVGNWNLILVEPSANPLKNLNENVDFVALVPMQLERILAETPEKIRLIKTIIVGGAPVSQSLINRLKEKEITVYQTFGMTETISHFALRKIGFETEPYYRTIQGVTIEEQDGNLLVFYPEMFDEPLLTTDLVNVYSNDKFEWIGRSDFVINSGGIKLNPEKIEQKLMDYISGSFFLTGIKDEILGEKLVLVVENSHVFLPNKSKLIQLLEKYEIPKLYVNIQQFDRTKSGKINRIQTIKKLNLDECREIV
jgi:O-succinylbenzoic acid--CoA ligase